MNLLLKEWPEELQRELKAQAALEDKTLKDVMAEAAEEWLRKRQRRPPRNGSRRKRHAAAR